MEWQGCCGSFWKGQTKLALISTPKIRMVGRRCRGPSSVCRNTQLPAVPDPRSSTIKAAELPAELATRTNKEIVTAVNSAARAEDALAAKRLPSGGQGTTSSRRQTDAEARATLLGGTSREGENIPWLFGCEGRKEKYAAAGP